MTEKISHPDWSFFLANFLPKRQTSYPDLYFSWTIFYLPKSQLKPVSKDFRQTFLSDLSFVWCLLLIFVWASVAQLGVFFSSDCLSHGPVSVSSRYVGLIGLFLRDNTLQWLGGLHAGLAFCVLQQRQNIIVNIWCQ